MAPNSVTIANSAKAANWNRVCCEYQLAMLAAKRRTTGGMSETPAGRTCRMVVHRRRKRQRQSPDGAEKFKMGELLEHLTAKDFLPMEQASLATTATLDWIGGVDGRLTLIDQTLLPLE